MTRLLRRLMIALVVDPIMRAVAPASMLPDQHDDN